MQRTAIQCSVTQPTDPEFVTASRMSSAHWAPHTECSSLDDHRDDDVDDHGDDDVDGDGEGDGGDDACDSISSIWSLSALLHTYKHQPVMLPSLMDDNK